MSLRQRLAVVLALGLSALILAALALAQILASTQAARERSAEAEAQAATQALADALPDHVDGVAFARGPDPELRRQLHQLATSVMRPVASSVGGYCLSDGALLATSGAQRDPAPREYAAGRLHPLSPDLETAVTNLCSSVHGPDVVNVRIDHKTDVELLRAQPIRDGACSWALVRVRAQETPAYSVTTVVLAVAAALLVAFTIEAMVALARGVASLRGALVKLSDDLGAPVPRPRARELADVAQGLEAMATRLAAARDRERDLGESLSREQRLAALGRVAAGVAHEVRNPLAGMKLRLDLLQRTGGLSAEARDDVNVCLGEVARLDRLVESLLSVGRAKTKPGQTVNLAAIADSRVAAATAAANLKGVRLVRLGEAVVESEPDALASALENLLRNAIEASPERGDVIVRIKDRGNVTVDVEDRGPGIPADRESELFEPFFTTKSEGTGLGLWMSRVLLEARGASLRYDRLGDVTRMRIEFPAPGAS